MIAPSDEDPLEPAPIDVWPGMIDLITAALMVFLLVTFVQTVLDPDRLEALIARSQQARFLDHFEAEFADEIDRGVIRFERRLTYLQITFSDLLLFDSGDYRLKGLGRTILQRCARIFARAGSSGYEQIQVEGHTDSVPPREGAEMVDNWELSTERALSVVRYLVSPGELPASVFSANGYADQRPVASNDDDEGRAMNRRIEIRVLFTRPHATDPEWADAR